MKDRIIGGAIVITATLIMLVPGGIVSAVMLAFIAEAGLVELYRVYGLEKSRLSALAYIGTIVHYVFIYFDKAEVIFPIVLTELLLLLCVYVISFPKYKDKDVFKVFFGFVYVTVLLSYVYRIRSLDAGLLLVLFILISSWGNDACAYFVGSAIGKHKLSPVVSPNKSVEGFVGGIIGAGLIGVLYAFLFKKYITLSAMQCAVIAVLGSIPAVIGDLAASAIKRDNDVKDYSNIIPGHGGIVDRIDSVIYIAPIIYYLVVLFNVT